MVALRRRSKAEIQVRVAKFLSGIPVLIAAIALGAGGSRAAENGAGPACANQGALGVSRVVSLDTTAGLHVGLKTYPQTLALGDKEVVLTFDDGPLPGATDKVLDALKAECVRATFFLIGRNAQAHPALARREIAEGHSVGHHSWSHPYKTLRGIAPDAAIAEIEKGLAADQQAATGVAWTGGRPTTPFFRFPGFADTPAALKWLDAQNIATFGADVWASDWTEQTPQAELALLMKRLERSRGGIVLLHDTRKQTVAMIPAFLKALKQGGYKIVHLTPGATPPALKNAPPGWTSETEAILKNIMPGLANRTAGAAVPIRRTGE
ncbi:MAG: polysaccharide deacetylase family protein [Hyphomicrobiales bacterium]|nr:polysaccharide deacetylase family protein [Hyphomicrobiales bacterium]